MDNVSTPYNASCLVAQQEKKHKRAKGSRIMRLICEIMLVIGCFIILLMVMLTHMANDQQQKRKRKRKRNEKTE